jgi:YggT family protein
MWAILSLIFAALELIIGLRFIFQLLGANPSSEFVTWIYNVSAPLVAPFTSVFGHATKTVPGTIPHSTFELATLIALVVYAIIGGIIVRFVTVRR